MSYKLLQQEAYDCIKEKITHGEFEPGIIYSETKIAAQIGVSRTPFKDALTRLSQDCYIDIIPSKGFKLHTMTDEDIINTYQVRVALECFCAIFVHEKRNTEDGRELIGKLKQCVKAMEEDVCKDTCIEKFLVDDFLYHSLLVEFLQNKEINKLFESFNHRQYDIAVKSLKTPGRFQKTIDEHKAIISAIESEDNNAVQQIYETVKEHMSTNSYLAANNPTAIH